MFAQTRDLSGLRVEEGKQLEIAQSGDPLDGTWSKPDPAYRKMMYFQEGGAMLLLVLFMIPVFLMMTIFIDREMWLFALLLVSPVIIMAVSVALLSRWSVNRMYDRHRFRITDEELIIETGFITTNRVLIPMVQIQQVNVFETWMGNRYGLKNVVVNTAGFTYVPNAGALGGNGVLMGLRNADEVAEAILSRVKHAKSRSKQE